MAQKIVTIYTDDLTGEESSDAATHTFSIDGVNYEIDLTSDSFDKFLEDMQPYTQNGRKLGRAKRSTGGKQPVSSQDTAEIRSWAKENGYEVNDRGRVPAAVREAYAKATS